VFLDDAGNPVRPTIVTHDNRLGGSLADLAQDGTLAEVERISGSRVMTGHFPPIYHLVRTQDAHRLDAARWILLAKDYLRYRLTGRLGTEICDATGTNLIAMPQTEWSDRLCTLLQVPRDKLPAIGLPAQVAGQVTRAAAKATSLQPGTPVVYGGGDSHCALVGLGVVGSGEAGLLLGTNSTLRASFEGLVKPQEQVTWVQQHVVPGRFTASASSMAGSSVMSWYRQVCVGQELAGRASYLELEALAAEIPPGSDGLLFHPYLFGERSPFYNPEATGAFLGIRHWHGQGHLVRSIMEGVAFAIANCADAIQAIAREAGQPIAVLRTGRSGGSRLATWRQIIADALDHTLEIVDIDEPGCLGAALLAGVGAGLYENLPAASQRTVRLESQAEPDPASVALYRDRRRVFNETYRVLESHLGQRIG
jgi:xylulokinase